MDFNKLFTRVKNILLTPKTEWPVIAEEPATVADVYKNYLVFVVAIPAIIGLLTVLGLGFGASIGFVIVQYVVTLGIVYVAALIVDALAPTFNGQKNQVQALKTVAYAFTAGWVASIGSLVPFLGWLIGLAGVIYGIYLFYLGLPHTMKCPEDKAGGYTALVMIILIVFWFVVFGIIARFVGFGMMGMGSGAGLFSSSPSTPAQYDEDSTLGKLEKYAENMEQATKKMEAAQKSGDSKAQQDALAGVMGAAFGGGKVESLAPDRLKPFIPETLAGRPRTNISVERNNAMGMQVSEARASFSNEAGESIDLEINDLGSAKGLIGLANFAGIEGEKETSSGYEKTYRENGRLTTERWDRDSSHGEYSIVLGERFTVKVQGKAGSINELKSALREINLAGLERLKGEGVQTN